MIASPSVSTESAPRVVSERVAGLAVRGVDPPDPGLEVVAGEHQLGEAHREPLQPVHIRLGHLGEHRPRRQRHGAQPVGDDPGQAGALATSLVEVDAASDRRRPVRSGRSGRRRRAAGDRGHRRPIAHCLVELVRGTELADALARIEAAEERGHVLLVDQFAVVGAAFEL